mmetsp:Transcript_8096/g.26875  ORF Transcript_8096/g.26875 Transcript_8096/m.26875 type:complete len:238 (-) Transcript_8096:735-1448(-)
MVRVLYQDSYRIPKPFAPNDTPPYRKSVWNRFVPSTCGPFSSNISATYVMSRGDASFRGSPPSCASVQYSSAGLSGRQFTPRGPARQELCAIGMESASGKLDTSLTVSPARFVIHTRFGNRPHGISYEYGRKSSSIITKEPSGEGSHLVCVRGAPSPNGVTVPVATSTSTNSELPKYSNKSASCESFNKSAYVRACATTPPVFVCTRGPRGVGGLAGRTARSLGTTHAASVLSSSQL